MVVLKLMAMTVLPSVVSVLLACCKKKSGSKSILAGIVLGFIAVACTEFGVDTGLAIINTRDASVICAGVFFGWKASAIAAAIASIERYLAPLWGVGEYTRLACSIATACAGVFTSLCVKFLFLEKRIMWNQGLIMGAFIEVFHMLLVFVTHGNDLNTAFTVVKDCSALMIITNSLAVAIAIICVSLVEHKPILKTEKKSISSQFGYGLAIAMIIGFIISIKLTYTLQHKLNTGISGDITVYVSQYMEILVFALLFIMLTILVRILVLRNVHQINSDLKKITNGDLSVKLDVKKNAEFESISSSINSTVDKLKVLIDEANERIDRELEFARKIQCDSLPSVYPPFPNIKDIDIFASMKTAKQVGGDFYNFFFVGSSKLFFLIADVSGKGIPAAMFMMKAKTLVENLAKTGASVSEIFTKANNILCENNDSGMFVTSWIGILDIKTGHLDYCNAGHNPPFIVGSKNRYVKDLSGLVLAAMPGMEYKSYSIDLKHGDKLFLYTDGVTEAADKQNQLFSEERLEEVLVSMPKESSCKDVCDCVYKNIELFVSDTEQFDDITMLCLEYR